MASSLLEVNAFAKSNWIPTIRPDESATIRVLLADAELSRDELPYSNDFSRLKKKYETAVGRRVTDSDFWRALVRVGKRGGLARSKSQKKKIPAPKLTTEQQLELLRLLPDGIGSRDQLPYTEGFDSLRRQFSKLTRTNFAERDFWRVLSRVAKRSRKPEPLFDHGAAGRLARGTGPPHRIPESVVERQTGKKH